MNDWIRVAAVDELPSGTWRVVEVEDAVVAVFNVDGEYHAIENVCTHDYAELTEGEVCGNIASPVPSTAPNSTSVPARRCPRPPTRRCPPSPSASATAPWKSATRAETECRPGRRPPRTPAGSRH